jgi:hypothetical protein
MVDIALTSNHMHWLAAFMALADEGFQNPLSLFPTAEQKILNYERFSPGLSTKLLTRY